jgi:hypothetical protein
LSSSLGLEGASLSNSSASERGAALECADPLMLCRGDRLPVGALGRAAAAARGHRQRQPPRPDGARLDDAGDVFVAEAELSHDTAGWEGAVAYTFDEPVLAFAANQLAHFGDAMRVGALRRFGHSRMVALGPSAVVLQMLSPL